ATTSPFARPSAARRAVFMACRASSGCCNMSTRVRFGREGIWAQRQCVNGRWQRAQRARRGAVPGAAGSFSAAVLIGALLRLLLFMRLGFENQGFELGRGLQGQNGFGRLFTARFQMKLNAFAFKSFRVGLNLHVLLEQPVDGLLRFVQPDRNR